MTPTHELEVLDRAVCIRWPDRFTLGVSVCFFLVGLFNVLHHEMWRDELQAWLIARRSSSIFELVRNMRYEGHPALWFLLLYAITRFTIWVQAMQLLNLAIATATAYLIAAYSPFTKFQKLLFCFGYFPLYEYGTISRNYALGLFFLFWFCASYRPDPKQNWIVSALMLSLLANTSIYGTLIAMAFAFALFVFPGIVAGNPRGFLAMRTTHVWAPALMFIGSVALAIVQMHPPPDGGFAMGWHLPTTVRSLAQTLSGVWLAFLPIPSQLGHFWNSNILESYPKMQWWSPLGSALIVSSSLLLLARKRFALLAYASATAGILIFMHVRFFGGPRHVGHLFIVFMACLWISEQYPEDSLRFHTLDRASRWCIRQRPRILTCLLVVHFVIAVTASWVDWAKVFSQSKSVATFLRSNGMAGMFMVGNEDYAASAVAGYLDREIYYPRERRMASFVVWNQARLQPEQKLIDAATDIATLRKEEVLIISNARLQTGGSSAREIAEFTGSVVRDEDYYLYLVHPDPCNGVCP
jgi:hypothetical protein